MTVVVGIILPNVILPSLVTEAVDGIILFSEEDNYLENEKWDHFVGGAETPDLALEYTDEEGVAMYYYIYNLTNPREFVRGEAKPHVTEVGPFGYTQIRRRYDVEFVTDDVVSFKSFTFHRRLSSRACTSGLELLGHPVRAL